MRDVVVVGAGIFGSVIAAALVQRGCTPTVVDARKPQAGSPPAACLMKPSWFSGLGRGVYGPALQLLDDLYGLETVRMRVTAGYAAVHWIPPKRILSNDVEVGRVEQIEPAGKHWRVTLANTEPLHSRCVVVAAGVWCQMLLPQFPLPEIVGQAGVAFLWPDQQIEQPFVRVWAPYRQLVAFNRGDGLWVGDGTAVREENWADQRTEQCLRRCRGAVAGDSWPPPRKLFGLRPYVRDAKPCYLKELRSGLWVATGGAKNGTIAAAWCASELQRALS